MKKGKAPSLDGFPIDFFQEFWDILKLDLVEVVREFQTNKKMFTAFNSAFPTLIPKKKELTHLTLLGLLLCVMWLL